MNLKNIFGEVIFSAAVETIAELVSRAIMAGTDLHGASLDGARLDGARLDGASLDGASLVRASLVRARLDGASLPSPTVVLLAAWGSVSEQLCADLMEYDCWAHGDRPAFDTFASNGACPYSGHLEERAACFNESGEIWKQGIGKLYSPRELMLRLFAEKKITR